MGWHAAIVVRIRGMGRPRIAILHRVDASTTLERMKATLPVSQGYIQVRIGAHSLVHISAFIDSLRLSLSTSSATVYYPNTPLRTIPSFCAGCGDALSDGVGGNEMEGLWSRMKRRSVGTTNGTLTTPRSSVPSLQASPLSFGLCLIFIEASR